VKIGYFTNQYPAVSHTFIRREIRAVETSGVTVYRYALRPGGSLVDDRDLEEQKLTRYVLRAGLFTIARCCLAGAFFHPLATSCAVVLAIRVGWRSDRGLLRHFAYLMEAAVLANWYRRDGVEHVHAHFGTNAATIAMLAWRLSGVPYSFTAHGPDEFEGAAGLSLDIKLEHAKFVACVSAFGRSQYMRWTPPRLWPKIVVVHCGLDWEYFQVPLLATPENPRLVCVGRLSEQKAQLVLIAAARKLREAGMQFDLVLAGDGPMRNQIEDAIRRFGLEGQVTITGWLPGDLIRAQLAAARALVLPSFSENMPVVIMESFALGRTVISTYIAGIPELVQAEKTGWLVQAGDENGLAEAMHDVLIASPHRLDAMAAAGRAQISIHHDAAKEALKLKSLFILDSPP
jgi:colanic acid/amylovoran biosynthesis glycosyltransferase